MQDRTETINSNHTTGLNNNIFLILRQIVIIFGCNPPSLALIRKHCLRTRSALSWEKETYHAKQKVIRAIQIFKNRLVDFAFHRHYNCLYTRPHPLVSACWNTLCDTNPVGGFSMSSSSRWRFISATLSLLPFSALEIIYPSSTL